MCGVKRVAVLASWPGARRLNREWRRRWWWRLWRPPGTGRGAAPPLGTMQTEKCVDDLDSDHRAVTFAFMLPGAVLRARAPWRFPLSLLANNDFVDELKDALDRPYG